MKYFIALMISSVLAVTPVSAEEKTPQPTKASSAPMVEIYDIGQTVVKLALKDGISKRVAIESMLSKAAELNVKMVGRLPVSEEVQARGIDTPYLEIFQFCNPADAMKMVAYDPIYSAYMPCRIALSEDKDGKLWLLTLNMDLLIDKFPLPEELRAIAVRVNGAILEIMSAASTGDF